MRNRSGEEPFARTRAAPSAATWDGCWLRGSQEPTLATPPRVARRGARRNDAHAAEEVVAVRPFAHLEAGRGQRGEGLGAEPGLDVDDRAGRMEPGAVDRGLGLESLVEHPGHGLKERSPQARASRGAG